MAYVAEAAAVRAKSAAEALSAPVLRLEYRPDAAHTTASLARVLLDGESARRAAGPAWRGAIDSALTPFRVHFENLLAGRVLEDGVWRTQAEVDADAREARYRLFEREYALTLPGLAATDTEVRHALHLALGIAGAAVVLALVLMIGRRPFPVRLAGFALIVLIAVIGFRTVSQIQAEPTLGTGSANATTSPVLRLLYLAASSDPTTDAGTDRSITVSQADLSSFLREQVRWETDPSGTGVVRQGLDIILNPREPVVREQVAWQGRRGVLSHQLRRVDTPAGPGLVHVESRLGSWSLPDQWGGVLWSRLAGALTRNLPLAAVRDQWQIDTSTAGQARFEARFEALPAPATSPTPSVVPEPVVARPPTPAAPAPPAPDPAPPVQVTETESVAVVSPAAPIPPGAPPADPAPSETEDAAPAAPGPVDTKNPRVYVGSAYQPAMTDFSENRDAWPVTGANAGFHLHPVGWHPSYAKWRVAENILRGFKHHVFTSEEDIGSYTRGGRSMKWPSTLIREGQRYGQRWRCIGITVNFGSVSIVGDPDKAANDLREFCADARKAKVPVYLLFSPVSPSATKVYTELSTRTRGEYAWVRVAKAAEADGIAIDFPARNVLTMNEKFLDLARTIATSSQKAGLKFIWMFNGGQGAETTESAAKKIRRMNVRPDYWIVSHFHNREYRGTPEDGNDSVTSQSRVLIEGKF